MTFSRGSMSPEVEFEEIIIKVDDVVLNKDEKYVFFLSITGGDINNAVWVRVFNEKLYSGGDVIIRVEEGWQFYDYFDILFKIYGRS